MAYKKDEDLEFLRAIKDNELHTLVEVLTKDTDGKTRHTEELTSKNSYKQHYPNHQKYIDDILEEFQKFGGHSAVNALRGGGVLYKEILCDICDKKKVQYSKKDTTIEIEGKLIEKFFGDIKELLGKKDPKALQEMTQELNIHKESGRYMYQVSAIVASAVAETVMATGVFSATALTSGVLGTTALTNIATTLGASRIVGFINPVMAAATSLWLVSDMMGPAYRVTIPATLQIAFLRQRSLHKGEDEEWQKNHKKVLEGLKNIDERLSEEQKTNLAKGIMKYLKFKLNILIVGGTGVGKSSTIAALFKGGKNIEIGTGVQPQTQEIKRYDISETITLWDSPGLGESKERDEMHTNKIIAKLQEKNEYGKALIDLVIVILDAHNKELETAYKLINQIIIPNIQDKERILIALNKCDTVIDRVDFVENGRKLTKEQIKFLDNKVEDIKQRIKKDTNVDVEPIYCSAGLKKGDKPQEEPYNIAKLLYYITEKTPPKKRLAYIEETNKPKGSNDGGRAWSKEAEKKWSDSLFQLLLNLVEKNKDEIVNAIKASAPKIMEVILNYFSKK